MNRVLITRPIVGICHMQVCCEADATDEEILAVCNEENPAGTTAGWTSVVHNNEEAPQQNPIKCEMVEGRVHYLVCC